MLDKPGNWQNYYHGDAYEQRIARKYSFSDRARYYMSEPAVEESVKCLISNINSVDLPLSLLSQYMPREFGLIMKSGKKMTAEELIYAHIGFCLDDFYKASIL